MRQQLRRFIFCTAVFFGASAFEPAVARGRRDFWRRVAASNHAHELATVRAVERVLNGKGGELDLLLVRTALVELMRQEHESARTVVLLFHLRRQLGFSAPRGGKSKLAQVLELPLSHFDRALGYYELARLELDGVFSRAKKSLERSKQVGVFRRTFALLDRALASAWESELRAEILVYRGLGRLRLHQASRARADFLLASQLSQDAARLAEAHLGLAFAALEEGPGTSFQTRLELARTYRDRVRHALPRPVMGGLPMNEDERRVLSLLMANPEVHQSFDLGVVPPEQDDCRWLLDEKSTLGAPFSAVASYIGSSCSLAKSIVPPGSR